MKLWLRVYILALGFLALGAGLYIVLSGKTEPRMNYNWGGQSDRGLTLVLSGLFVLGGTSYGWWKQRFRGERDDLL